MVDVEVCLVFSVAKLTCPCAVVRCVAPTCVTDVGVVERVPCLGMQSAVSEYPPLPPDASSQFEVCTREVRLLHGSLC